MGLFSVNLQSITRKGRIFLSIHVILIQVISIDCDKCKGWYLPLVRSVPRMIQLKSDLEQCYSVEAIQSMRAVSI